MLPNVSPENLDILCKTRRQLFETYGLELGLAKRESALKEVLTPDIVRNLMIEAITNWNCIGHDGIVLWNCIAHHIPIEGHAINGSELRMLAFEYFLPSRSDESMAAYSWWWRLRLIRNIPDPAIWLIQKDKERKRHKITSKIFFEVFGRTLTRDPHDYIRIRKVIQHAQAAILGRQIEERV
ncbi:MAG: hypothetical protein N2049_06955 [Anaerolineales bacterium]|uniref:Uncharacterized protein n=1 Tax=Thermanaerothrix solaris TaxID=3058434 RepID=A0ABU3NS07_9CHLR|nr:hypothetical protein [Thermanaerothrix sp. 4228-RoL]MCX7608939.1 hypothetical protein [Anaerolineales bacterium]MDT8899603.1 hypothetical protein [Thermanaerothrix sp. 4228-RoL]